MPDRQTTYCQKILPVAAVALVFVFSGTTTALADEDTGSSHVWGESFGADIDAAGSAVGDAAGDAYDYVFGSDTYDDVEELGSDAIGYTGDVLDGAGDLKGELEGTIKDANEAISETVGEFNELSNKTLGEIQELRDQTVGKINETYDRVYDETIGEYVDLYDLTIREFEELYDVTIESAEGLYDMTIGQLEIFYDLTIGALIDITEGLYDMTIGSVVELVEDLSDKTIETIEDLFDALYDGTIGAATDAIEDFFEGIYDETIGTIADLFGFDDDEELEELAHKLWTGSMSDMSREVATNRFMTAADTAKIIDASEMQRSMLEKNRLRAKYHHELQPSELVCSIGTVIRPVSATRDGARAASNSIQSTGLNRDLGSVSVSETGEEAITESKEMRARRTQYDERYCSPHEGGINAMEERCQAEPGSRRKNMDFSATIDVPMTIAESGYLESESSDDVGSGKTDTDALLTNLVGYDLSRRASSTGVSEEAEAGDPKTESRTWQQTRSMSLLRGPARDAIAAIIAEKSEGVEQNGEFIRSAFASIGMGEEEIRDLVGEKPSAYAVGEVISKILYQNPDFYVALGEGINGATAAGVAMLAAQLMEDRNRYEACLRTEMVLAALLEAKLRGWQEKLDARRQTTQRGTGSGNSPDTDADSGSGSEEETDT